MYTIHCTIYGTPYVFRKDIIDQFRSIPRPQQIIYYVNRACLLSKTFYDMLFSPVTVINNKYIDNDIVFFIICTLYTFMIPDFFSFQNLNS